MYVGSATLCLRVSGLEQAVRFYEAIGMKVVPNEGTPGQSAFVRRGNFYIMLMNNFGGDSVTFRGADAFDVFEHLRAEGFELEGQPGRGDDEECYWATRDPDGHGIFFNTRKSETTSEHRKAKVTQLLHSTEQDLVDLRASDDCLRAFREFSARFGSA